MSRLFLSLTDEEIKRFDSACERAGLTRSQYLKCLLGGRIDIRPPVLKYKKLITELSDIERDLKMIAMKEELSDEDRLLVMTKLSDIKDLVKERLSKEDENGDRG